MWGGGGVSRRAERRIIAWARTGKDKVWGYVRGYVQVSGALSITQPWQQKQQKQQKQQRQDTMEGRSEFHAGRAAANGQPKHCRLAPAPPCALSLPFRRETLS
jgi:hypothetical protein